MALEATGDAAEAEEEAELEEIVILKRRILEQETPARIWMSHMIWQLMRQEKSMLIDSLLD